MNSGCCIKCLKFYSVVGRPLMQIVPSQLNISNLPSANHCSIFYMPIDVIPMCELHYRSVFLALPIQQIPSRPKVDSLTPFMAHRLNQQNSIDQKKLFTYHNCSTILLDDLRHSMGIETLIFAPKCSRTENKSTCAVPFCYLSITSHFSRAGPSHKSESPKVRGEEASGRSQKQMNQSPCTCQESIRVTGSFQSPFSVQVKITITTIHRITDTTKKTKQSCAFNLGSK